MKILRVPIEFDWDRWNSGKNHKKHGVTDEECEEVCFDPGKRMMRDTLHSGVEDRYLLIGKTKSERLLFVVFTWRGHKMRVVSARDLNKREQYLYET